jgi:PilZ domain
MSLKPRRDRRFPVQLPATLRVEQRDLKVTVHDISLSGARVSAGGAPPTGSSVQLSTVLPPAAPITVQAKVIWTGRGAFGVRFVGALPPRLVVYCTLLTAQ